MVFNSRIPEPRAKWTYSTHENVIAVMDHDEGRSVTNDAEHVIARLATNSDLSQYRVEGVPSSPKLSDAVSVKPGLRGISVEVPKVWKWAQNRWPRRP